MPTGESNGMAEVNHSFREADRVFPVSSGNQDCKEKSK
jgi:hypothetical protein